MSSKTKFLASFTKFPLHNLQQYRTIAKVRLKWVKNRSLDHIIDVQTDLKAACLIKDAIIRSPTGYLTSKSLLDSQKLLGLTVPTMRFIRRYPSLFEEYPHPKYPSLACFKLTQLGKMMQEMEMRVFEECEGDIVERLCRVLMMTKNKMLPLQSLHPLKWDLGLPDDFDRSLIKKYPDHFRVGFQEGKSRSRVPHEFPKGLRCTKEGESMDGRVSKVALHFSVHEDSRGIDPDSELMEKRLVGVLHEFLGLTIYKKTKRNYLRCLREELNLPHKFTRIFTRYPGIFYLSLKCKTTTVALREGYRRGRLVDPHPLARHRDKLYYVMRTGLIYRNKAADMLTHLNNVVDNVEDNAGEEESDEEEIEAGNEYYDSEAEIGSDED
ncbi:hypothetical protein DH2020_039401 [Rehmannia glutinosa]|uniref:PORR domain-containing protein n=1 Tax=Rehmannia glutinosa TaxID=99300 RepID=A0ABR0UY18_REHGL